MGFWKWMIVATWAVVLLWTLSGFQMTFMLENDWMFFWHGFSFICKGFSCAVGLG
jgi:hypothetical protein